MCVCNDGVCIHKLYQDVEKMSAIIPSKSIGVYHTNFPVSAKALKSFKNPLGRVGFTSANPKKTLKQLVPDMFP